MKLLFSIIFLYLSTNILAQKQGNIWCFGNNAGLDFNTNPPKPFLGSVLSTDEGSASIADPVTGSLLFYTDGVTVWDKNHHPMPGSMTTPLNGNESSTQSAVIVPLPGSATEFYIFTTPSQIGTPVASLCYSIVDMSLNSGNGDIKRVNTVLMDSSTEKLAAVAANCREYWIVGHRWNDDSFYAFRLTSAGLSDPIKSKSGMVHKDVGSGSHMESIGYMKFASNARKLGLVTNANLNVMQLFDFNSVTGEVSNPLTDDFSYKVVPPNIWDGLYGCSFSPDNSKFYVSYLSLGDTSCIYQYDMQAADIIASRKLIVALPKQWISALQNGPNGKLYISTPVPMTSTLDVIHNPNNLGTDCHYEAKVQPIGTGTAMHGLPVIVENFLSLKKVYTINICSGNTHDEPLSGKNLKLISPDSSFTINADSSGVRFFPDSTTTYTIISTNECGFTDTMQFSVTVLQPPVAEFDFMPTAPKLSDAMLTLVNKSSGANKYAWYTDGVKTSDSIHFKMPNPGLGTHCYTLNASAMLGCEDTVTHCIEVVKSSIAIPNAFSPNKDGRNDVFKALLFSPYKSFSLSIFNRYGQEVFATKDPNNGWDGTFHNQQEQLGVFYYLIKVVFNYPEEEIYKGDVTLIR